MFKVGVKYKLELLDSYGDDGVVGITTYYGCTVIDTDGPLIKISAIEGNTIINTNSPAFFRATEQKS